MIRTICSSLLLAGALAVASLQAAEPFPESALTSGFAIGCQAWSFNHYTVFEAIEKTQAVGGKTIEFYPGQKFSADEPTLKWDHNATPEMIEKVKAALKEHGLLAVAYGVVKIPNDAAGARKIFEFAKTMGLRVINTESVDAIDIFEPLVKEFDIKVGFHDHPKRPNDPSYQMWDPNYILSVVKDRDPRIGSCADTGHWQRSGLSPIDCLHILKGHVVSSHLKDLNVMDHDGHDVPYGTGVGQVKEVLDEYRAQNFVGPISVEYEYHMTESMPEIKQSIDFVRAYGEKK